MADETNRIKQKIRAVLNEENKFAIEVGAILAGTGSLDNAMRAAKAEYRAAKDDTSKAILLNLISTIHLESNRYEEAERIALKSAGQDGLPSPVRAFSFCLTAWVHIRREDYPLAETYCKKALALAGTKDDTVLIFILNALGAVNVYQEKYSLALEYYRVFREAAGKTGNRIQLISALHNIALTLSRLGREDEAVKNILQAENFAREINDRLRLGYVLNTLGHHYLHIGELDKALANEREALEIFEEVGHRRMFADCHIDLARIQLGLGETNLAAEHAAAAVKYAEELEQKSNLPIVHEVLGIVLAARNNSLAAVHLAKSVELFRELRPGGNAEGVEFALFEYGKYLLERSEAEGASHIRESAAILKKRPSTSRVKKALREIERIQKELQQELISPHSKDIEKIERDRDNLRLILDITKAINSEKEMNAVLERIIDAAIRASGAERGFIVLIENGKWEFAARSNFINDITSEPDYAVMHEIITSVVSKGTVFTAGNIGRTESLSTFVSTSPRTLKGVFVFPLKVKNRILGAVYLDSRFAVVDFPQHAAGFMMTLMEQAALIVDKARLFEEVRILSEKLGEKLQQTRSDLQKMQRELELRYSYKNIVGASSKMREIFDLLDKVVENDLPVYIHGDSGTGKELVAKAIHYNSTRKEKHFVALNCAAIPENLLESELFGYEKGAFTGADSTRQGLFEIASGGTFFLDEIGNMSPSMQQKLLRVLQEKEIRRIGGKKLIKVDARIISASNVDPQELRESGRLRSDLFFRLNVLMIKLPPLRKRKEDIPLLVEHFWKSATGTPLQASPEKLKELFRILEEYDWPGNVRELENEVNRLVSLGEGILNAGYLSKHILKGLSVERTSVTSTGLSIKEMEKSLILEALKKAKGNKSKAARLLEIPRTSLNNKIKQFGIFYRDDSP